MATPNSRETLKEYCLRKLGKPVIQVNVSEEQLDDRIDDALQMFNEYHFDGKEASYMIHEITQEEVDQGYLQLPDTVFGVTGVLNKNTGGGVFDSGIFNVEYQIHLSDYFNRTGIYSFSGEMTNYYIVKRHLNLMDFMFNGPMMYDFNRKTGKLYLRSHLTAGEKVILRTYTLFAVDSNGDPIYDNIWNDEWVKKYAVELVRQQWGANLSKYDGIQMPGGVTFNGYRMMQDANAAIATLEDELKNQLQEPADFFVG